MKHGRGTYDNLKPLSGSGGRYEMLEIPAKFECWQVTEFG